MKYATLPEPKPVSPLFTKACSICLVAAAGVVPKSLSISLRFDTIRDLFAGDNPELKTCPSFPM